MNKFEQYQQGGYELYMHGQQPKSKIPGRIACVYETELTPVGYAVQWTGVKNWPERYLHPSEYEKYLKHGSGICLKCGCIVGIDVDVEDKDLAVKIADLMWDVLGPGVVRTRNNSNKFLVFYKDPYEAVGSSKYLFSRRYENGKSISQQIEILGQGRQFVAEGIHSSGVPYVIQNWMPINELPIIEARMLGRFIREAIALVPEHYEIEPHPSEGVTSTENRDSDGAGVNRVVDLYTDFEVQTERGTTTTVGSIVQHMKEWDGAYCRDPYEPDYAPDNNRIARIYVNDGKPLIYSFAHHGITYHLHDHTIGDKLCT